MERLSNQGMLEARLEDSRKLAQALHARYRIADFAAGARFAAAVALAADAADHYPELRITNGAVDVALCTHEAGLWVTQQDLDLARRSATSPAETG